MLLLIKLPIKEEAVLGSLRKKKSNKPNYIIYKLYKLYLKPGVFLDNVTPNVDFTEKAVVQCDVIQWQL